MTCLDDSVTTMRILQNERQVMSRIDSVRECQNHEVWYKIENLYKDLKLTRRIQLLRIHFVEIVEIWKTLQILRKTCFDINGEWKGMVVTKFQIKLLDMLPQSYSSHSIYTFVFHSGNFKTKDIDQIIYHQIFRIFFPY